MIYVLSDIHGNTRRFRSVLKQITWGEEDWLYVLGDMADRGADGIAIMEELMHRPNTVVLQGNHERMFLDVFHEPDNEKFTNRWHRNGGDVTKQAFEELPQERREALISWLEQLPLEINLEVNGQKYCLVHAAPRELYDQFETDNDLDMYTVWYRVQPEEKLFSDRITVFGHTPTKHFQDTMPLSVWYGDRRIAIDCGAAYEEPGCRLACVRLDDGKVFYSEEDRILTTPRLTLRPWTESDAEALYEYASDPAVGPAAGWNPHESVDASLDVIRSVLCGQECYAICEKGSDRPIGAIELMPGGSTNATDRRDECELGYWLGKPFWGRGYMPEAAEELLRRGFEELHLRGVWCAYYEGNAKSKRVQEKLGFSYHHTAEHVFVEMMEEYRTEIFNYMSKAQWEEHTARSK